MKQLQTILIALVALLGVVAAAEASVDLWTPPLVAQAGQYASCRLSNVTALARTVQIRIYDYSGTVNYFTPVFQLAPFSNYNLEAVGFLQFMCRFTAPSKATVRGAAAVVSGGGSDTAAVPAQ